MFREWRAAVERSLSIMNRHFIVPVIVDEDYQGDPSRYHNFPHEFSSWDFGRAPAGEPDDRLVAMLRDEIRAMRRRGTV